jgi:toluene monooxygenase system protein E
VKGQKTYWHLLEARRRPSEYEIGSSRLLYYPARGGFAVDVPLGGWYATYQQGSPLRSSDWDAFADPRETTYARYAEIQSRKETYVAGLLEALEVTGYDRSLSPAWVGVLDRVLAPLRYPMHGLQMVAAHVGSMAPAGRITIAAALQAADEMRRVHLLAYRLRQLQETYPELGRHSRAAWQEDPMWQPLRRLVEQLLVTYDWGEALVALDAAVKPALDELFTSQLGLLAASQGDEILAKICRSLGEDCAWHREWSRALLAHVVAEDPGNLTWVDGWIEKWHPDAERAVDAFAPVWEEAERSPRPAFPEVRAAVEAEVRRQRQAIRPAAGVA